MQFYKYRDPFYWTESYIKVFKMRLMKRRNKLLQFFVISLIYFIVCHPYINVEAKASSQVSINKGEIGLSDIFSKAISLSPQYRSIIDTDDNNEYYYDEDYDPYGIGNGETVDESSSEDYYSNDESEGNENSSAEKEFSSKSGMNIV